VSYARLGWHVDCWVKTVLLQVKGDVSWMEVGEMEVKVDDVQKRQEPRIQNSIQGSLVARIFWS
jgi:hypothetical protein